MRYNQLIEAKFRKPVTMFHGTSTKFLRTILKTGIEPFPKTKMWDVDPNADEKRSSRASVGGSYWTSNLLTATSSALNTKQKFGGDSLIVIANIQQQQSFMDEDNVTFETNHVMTETIRDILSVSPEAYPQIAHIFYDNKELKTKMQKYFVEKFHSYMIYNKNMPVPKEILQKHFDNYFIRIFSHLKNKKDSINDVFRYVENKPEDIPTVQEAEKMYQNTLDKITKYYRKNAIELDDNSFNHTLRITEPVTFGGANKITHLIEIPDNYEEKLILHYGDKNNIPEKFIKEYRGKKGELFGIVDKYGNDVL